MKEINSQKELLTLMKSDKLVCVKFGTAWCHSCRLIEPSLEKLCGKHGIDLYDCDVNTVKEASGMFGITTLPTSIFFKNGDMVYKILGSHSISYLSEIFEQVVNK